MRCPKCISTPHTVRLEESVEQEPYGHAHIFWDQKDQMHVHDPRWAIRYFSCSNGHRFERPTEANTCSESPGACDWPARQQPLIDKSFAERAKRHG